MLFSPGPCYKPGLKGLSLRAPHGDPLVPARNRAGTKGLAFSPASGVPVGKLGLKPLTGRD
jgi:hypothetical protein